MVRLEQNYRSTPAIVATANQSDARVEPVRSPLQAAVRQARPRADRARLSDTTWPRRAAVAQQILELIEAGTPPEKIAVLYRINVQAAALETALGDAGVSYLIRGAKRFFDLPEVKQAVMQLRAASVSIVGEPLFKSVSDVLRSLGWSQTAPEAPRFGARPVGVAQRADGSGRRGAGGNHFSAVHRRTHGTPGRSARTDGLGRHPGHAALGEGPRMGGGFRVGLSEGLVPISYARTFEQIDEERRLLYVGVTRARRMLALSWSGSGRDQRAPRERSRFLTELGIRSARVAGARGA